MEKKNIPPALRMLRAKLGSVPEATEVKESSNQNDRDQPDLKNDQDQPTPLLHNPVVIQPRSDNPVVTQPRSNTTSLPHTPVVKQPRSNATPLLHNPVKGGYFYPNWIDDQLLPTLEPLEQVVLRRIIRLTLGFNRLTSDAVSISKLAERCNLSEFTIKKEIKVLEKKGLIKVHRDFSGNKITGGNKYEILFTSQLDGVVLQPRSNATPLSDNHITHDHDDLNNTNHHQKDVKMTYQTLTGNTSWTKSDSAAYEKLKHLSLQEISNLIKSTLEKAHQKPASLAYFVKAYLNPIQANPANKQALKAKLAAIVERKREAHVGTKYTIADLTFDVKAECLREGILFDNALFNEILENKQL